MTMYGETYKCDHPVYDKCTLFKIGRNGLAVIQQQYDENTKITWWARSIRGLQILYIYIKIFLSFSKREPDNPKTVYILL